MSSNEPCNCDQALALQKQVDELLELNNLRATAIKKQSRLLMDLEVIESVDIVLGVVFLSSSIPSKMLSIRL